MADAKTQKLRRRFAGSFQNDTPAATARDRLSGALRSLRRGGDARPEFVLIPQNLRTSDPGFFAELAAGTMGLAGATVRIEGTSPFRVTPPNDAWRSALLGFGWLNDIRGAQSPEAQGLAQETVEQWIVEERPFQSDDWATDVAARRMISWLTNAGMLAEGVPAGSYDRFAQSCDLHMKHLLHAAPNTVGYAKLVSYMALVMGCLCMTGQERRFKPAMLGLQRELENQILPCGGHVSRNPGVLVEVMLDLLPLKQCFIARDIELPPHLSAALGRISPMLRHLQLGDRQLCRFNGMGATEMDKLATVLSYDVGETNQVQVSELSSASRYIRLVRRSAIVLMDGGVPPAGDLSCDAGAGTLAFEMSSGDALLVVNAGAPGPADQSWRVQSRGTAAHSALMLNDTASSRLKPAGRGGPKAPLLLLGPTQIDTKIVEPGDGTIEVHGSHNGYLDRFGLAHSRVLALSAQGDRLTGTDRVFQSQRFTMASNADRTFSIHFHLHPQTRARFGADPGTAELELPNGETWLFTSRGAKLGLEDSLFFANFSGPRRTVQVVLRGQVRQDIQVHWTIARRSNLPKPELPPTPQL